MPWCVRCNKFLTPPSVKPDGTCPRCGGDVERGLVPGMTRPAEDAPPAVPWHFKLLLLALVVYLGWRFLEIGSWLVDQL